MSVSSTGGINQPLAQVENFEEVWIANRPAFDDVDITSEELLQRGLEAVRHVAPSGTRLRKKLHHKVQITRLGIERPLHGRSKDPELLYPILLAKRAHLAEVLGHDLR